MTAPPTNPEALREALAESMLIHEWPQAQAQLVPFAEQCSSVRRHWLAKADALMAGPLASTLTRCDAATAQAERTAGELAAARDALSQIAAHPRDYDDGVRSFGVGWAFSNVKDIARAALTEESPHAE